jgi:hypothetical protein
MTDREKALQELATLVKENYRQEEALTEKYRGKGWPNRDHKKESKLLSEEFQIKWHEILGKYDTEVATSITLGDVWKAAGIIKD